MTSAIIVVAICAIIGARLYHVIDDWHLYADDPVRAVLPPYAGLGLYGGIIGATVGIWIFLRGRDIPFWRALDIVVPGTLLAQGIARWGNFFNQELYGPPTDLPWAIAIDCAAPHQPLAARRPVPASRHEGRGRARPASSRCSSTSRRSPSAVGCWPCCSPGASVGTCGTATWRRSG